MTTALGTLIGSGSGCRDGPLGPATEVQVPQQVVIRPQPGFAVAGREASDVIETQVPVDEPHRGTSGARAGRSRIVAAMERSGPKGRSTSAPC